MLRCCLLAAVWLLCRCAIAHFNVAAVIDIMAISVRPFGAIFWQVQLVDASFGWGDAPPTATDVNMKLEKVW